MQDIIQISTHKRNGLYDITTQVKDLVRKSGIPNGMVSVYVQGATAAIMIIFKFMYPLYRTMVISTDV
jgi:thiamine phosphate synthase YjbQ (UPF0047 family)